VSEQQNVTGGNHKHINGQLAAKSKYLSWLLRHGAYEQNLTMDEAGWVKLKEILPILDISQPELEQIVNTDTKQRFQLINQSIRACQGHSTKNRAVTPDALENSWLEYTDDHSIWHSTTAGNIFNIACEGIKPMARTHVHCASRYDSSVGKRTNAPILLEISPSKIRDAGLKIFVAPNGVVLTRYVPPEAIINLIAVTKRAKKQEATLRKYLGLSLS